MENRSRGGNIFVCVLHRDACVRGETGAKMRATGGIGRQSGRRRAEETKPDRYTPQKPGVTGNETPGFAVSEATARHIHCPCFVALDQLVNRLLRRQAFVNVDRDGHVTQGKRRPVVRPFVRQTQMPLHRPNVVWGRKAQAVFVAADVQVVCKISTTVTLLANSVLAA